MNIGSYGFYTNKFIQTSNASRDNVNFGNKDGEIVKLIKKRGAQVDVDGIDHAGTIITPSAFQSDKPVEINEEDIPGWKKALGVLAKTLGICQTAKFHQ